jgi:hypothetical protein
MLADYSFYDKALVEFNASEKKRAQANQIYAIDNGNSSFGTFFAKCSNSGFFSYQIVKYWLAHFLQPLITAWHGFC